MYRLIEERVPIPDQGQAVGIMSSTVPQDRFPEVVGWMFPLLGEDDRENMTRIWQMAMPPPVFDCAKQLIQAAMGADWEATGIGLQQDLTPPQCSSPGGLRAWIILAKPRSWFRCSG